jgi:hypothetical protein
MGIRRTIIVLRLIRTDQQLLWLRADGKDGIVIVRRPPRNVYRCDSYDVDHGKAYIVSCLPGAYPVLARRQMIQMSDFIGAPDTIRTCDLCLRRAKLVAAAPAIGRLQVTATRKPGFRNIGFGGVADPRYAAHDFLRLPAIF